MPRLPADDYLQNFRFRVIETDPGIGVMPSAGFTTVTTPTINIEHTEHRVGNETWTKKLRGVPTVDDGTLSKGILLADTVIFDWVIKKVLGRQPYRTDLTINQYNQEKDGTKPGDMHSRQEIWRDCSPNSVKPMGDLDASASDVSLQELTVSVEEVLLDAKTATELGMTEAP